MTASEPFDATAAIALLKRIEREAGLPEDSHMRAAIEASLAALSAREAHSADVARYALERVAIDIERRLLGASD
ncbi:hypothetical protein [Lichenibacterium ramalinae]|uniref:hypothetical protein n=1 Tax=Lichenibacterium ramalinae TaxID=2316527 RepID=UPI0013EB5165|nr:hypothetical protein [Lichenibacterium ramalinae]